MSAPLNKPAIIVVSSHVARRAVGNRAATFALERLGFPVIAVPSVLLSWHPGVGPATRIVPTVDSFAATIDDLIGAPWLGTVGAILSGYLGEDSQAAPVAALVEAVKAGNPDALYLAHRLDGAGSPDALRFAVGSTLHLVEAAAGKGELPLAEAQMAFFEQHEAVSLVKFVPTLPGA